MYVLKITLVSVSMVGGGFRKLKIKVFSLGLELAVQRIQ